jgi:hypothetical protein
MPCGACSCCCNAGGEATEGVAASADLDNGRRTETTTTGDRPCGRDRVHRRYSDNQDTKFVELMESPNHMNFGKVDIAAGFMVPPLGD